MAILADTEAKQCRHLKDLEDALALGRTFDVATLLAMEEYPRQDSLGAFYGQCASLAEFLVDRKNPEQFVSFIDRAIVTGYDEALRECYGISGVGELDREWRRHLDLTKMERADSKSGVLAAK